MKQIHFSIEILLLTIYCSILLNAQPSDKTLKSYLSQMKGQQVFFNDGTPPATISEITNEYFIAKVHNFYSILIPYHSICKIEMIGEQNKIITVFLFYHKEGATK